MKAIPLAGLLALSLAQVSWAAGTLQLQAQTPTRIYLDSEFVGETPLVLSDLQPGSYRVQAEEGGKGELRTYMFHVPTRVNVTKVLDVTATAPVVTAPTQPVVYTNPPVKQVVYAPAPAQPRPVVCATPRVNYTNPPRSWGRTSTYRPARANTRYRSKTERAKVHTRNAILGGLLANQTLTGNSRNRKRYRNVGLGLGLLNEIFR